MATTKQMSGDEILSINLKQTIFGHKCSACGKSFISNIYLSKHISKRHVGATERLERLLETLDDWILDSDSESTSESDNPSCGTSAVELLANRLVQLGLDPNGTRLDNESTRRIVDQLSRDRRRFIQNDCSFEDFRLANELKLERAFNEYLGTSVKSKP